MESKIRRLIKELPRIAGCPSPERLGYMFTLAYDNSLEEGTPLDREKKDMESLGRRLYCINPSNHDPKDKRKATIGFYRLIIAENRGYLAKGYITEEQFKQIVETMPEAKEPVAEIDEILTYDQALSAEYWWI